MQRKILSRFLFRLYHYFAFLLCSSDPLITALSIKRILAVYEHGQKLVPNSPILNVDCRARNSFFAPVKLFAWTRWTYKYIFT